MVLDPKTAAEEWYTTDAVFAWLNRNVSRLDDETLTRRVPKDVDSLEFAAWLTLELRLAMAKGIQRANDANESVS